jgi:hypothetical protein
MELIEEHIAQCVKKRQIQMSWQTVLEKEIL